MKVASLGDLCRLAANLDFSSESLIRDSKDGERIMLLGEGMGNTVVAYYVETKEKGSLIKYTFPEHGRYLENVEFVQGAEAQPNHYISILSADLGSFKSTKKINPKDVLQIRMGSPGDIINAVIRKAVRNEALLHLYAFKEKGKTVICGFDLLDQLNDDQRTFYYAMAKEEPSGFARYSYSTNRFEFTNTVGEYSYMYVKIINLAEKFPFFKVPD